MSTIDAAAAISTANQENVCSESTLCFQRINSIIYVLRAWQPSNFISSIRKSMKAFRQWYPCNFVSSSENI